VLVAEKCAFTQKIGITLAPKKQGDRTAKRSFNHLVGAVMPIPITSSANATGS
jgi:hypothetical protein